LYVVRLIEKGNVNFGIACGQRRAQQQAGEVLAGGRGDGGRASGESAGNLDRGLAVVFQAAAVGPEVFEGVEQGAYGTGLDLLIACEGYGLAWFGKRGRAKCDSQGRSGVADVNNLRGSDNPAPSAGDLPEVRVGGVDVGAERAVAIDGGVRVAGEQGGADDAAARRQGGDCNGADRVRF